MTSAELTDHETPAIWQAALSDAGLSLRDADLYLADCDELPSGDRATTWPAGVSVDQALGDVLGLKFRLTHGRAIVVVAQRQNPVVLGALMRHELQHVVQFHEDSNLYRRFLHAVDALVESSCDGLDYQRIPMEIEANYYASRFARSHFGDEVVDQMAKNESPLLGRKGSSAMDELMKDFVRTVRGQSSTRVTPSSPS